MKTIIRPLIFAGTMFLLSTCKINTSPSKQQEGQNAPKDSLPALPSETVAHLKDDQLNAIYQQYSHLTTALTGGNLAEAKIAALAIEAGAEKMKNAGILATSAAKIAVAKNLEDQRYIYATLSNDFIILLKKTGLGKGTLYIAHCPMAMNDKGAVWLSSSKEIRNPYFGESMLSCGTLQETLNPQ